MKDPNSSLNQMHAIGRIRNNMHSMVVPAPGPAVAGILAERTGSFSSSFYMAAAFAGAAIVLSGFLRAPIHKYGQHREG